MSNPFRYFTSSPEVIRLVVMMQVRYPLSLRNVEDLLAERGIDMQGRPKGRNDLRENRRRGPSSCGDLAGPEGFTIRKLALQLKVVPTTIRAHAALTN